MGLYDREYARASRGPGGFSPGRLSPAGFPRLSFTHWLIIINIAVFAIDALASARATVEIMHLLGAADRQITAVFLRDVLREAVFGALLGALLGTGAVWLLGQQFAALGSGMTSGGGLLLLDWLVIAAIPLAGVVLALVTARITIAFALRDML
jgi:cell division transport system permease protein